MKAIALGLFGLLFLGCRREPTYGPANETSEKPACIVDHPPPAEYLEMPGITTIFTHNAEQKPGNLYFNQTSSMELLDDGSLVVSWGGGRAEGSTDSRIVIARSTDGGASWTPPETIIDPFGDELARGTVLFHHGGRLWLMVTAQVGGGTGTETGALEGRLLASDDGGRTWDPPRAIKLPVARPSFPLHKPVVTAEGEVAFAIYWRELESNQTYCSALVSSSDLSSWEVRGKVSIYGRRTLEPVLLEVSPGAWRMLARTNLEKVYFTDSFDGGRTWTEFAPLNLPNQDALMDARMLSDGRAVAAWNNDSTRRDSLVLGVFSNADFARLESLVTIDRWHQSAPNYPHLLLIGDEALVSYTRTPYQLMPWWSDIGFSRKPLKRAEAATGTLAVNTTRLPEQVALLDVAFADAEVGWVVGNDGAIFKTVNGGASFRRQTRVVRDRLHDLVVLDRNTAIIVGDNRGIVRKEGSLLRTENGGETWSIVRQGAVPLAGVAFADELVGIAVGTSQLLRTEDGGVTWKTPPLVECSLADYRLEGVAFADSSTVWAVGDAGLVLRSLDAGERWERIDLGIRQPLRAIAIREDGPGAIVGHDGLFLITTDAGATWQLLPKPVDEHLVDAALTTDGSLVVVSDQGHVLTARAGDLASLNVQRADRLALFYGVGLRQDEPWVAGWNSALFPVTIP
jgi:photosystem II stability/assembly factor-like uncharacterized protein/predicted neuraminidase